MRFTNSRLRDGLIVLVAVLMAALYVKAAGGDFPLDDSWIHQTYGRNLAQYGQWEFIPGTPSAASTSPLYTVVLSVGYKLGIDFRLWTHGLGALALALTGLIGARLVEMAPNCRRFVPLATGLALVLAWHLIWAAVSGMETMIFCLFTLLLIWLGWRELTPRSPATRSLMLRGAIFGIAAALATLTRPEGVLLAGLIGLALLIARPNMTWRAVIVWGVAAALCFGIVLAPYLIFNLRLTGGLLPNTAAAKRAESAPFFSYSYLWRIGNVTTPLLAGGQLLLIPGMIAFVALLPRARKSLLFALLLIWPIALILLYAAWLPLQFQHGRYEIPALPAAIVAGVIGTAWLLERSRAVLIARVLTRTLALAAALLFALFAFGIGVQAYTQDVDVIDQEMVTTALWFKANDTNGALVAVHDIGALGYFAPNVPILDIAGLVSPEVVPLIPTPDAIWALMQQRGVHYLEALDNQIPGGDLHDPRLCPVPLFKTSGTAALREGGSNMTVYKLVWDDPC